MRLGVPYRYAFVLVIAMRFIPIFESERSVVRNAQVARGLSIDRGGPVTIWRLAKYTFTPMLVSGLSRADMLARSMDARGFGRYPDRTYIRGSRIRAMDTIAIISVLLLTVVIILTSILGYPEGRNNRGRKRWPNTG